jgi:secreted PhoX family phosphatase
MSAFDPLRPARRDVLRLAALSAAQLALLGCRSAPTPAPVRSAGRTAGFGPLVSRPGALLDLPEGFAGVSVQRAGTDRLDDGRPVPGCLDGMACFENPDGTWTLLRNHEIGNDAWVDEYRYTGQAKIVTWGPADAPVDPTMHGGVSRLVIDPAALRAALAGAAPGAPLVRSTRMALTGTDCNCSGGRFAEGWVSCEETDTPGHGYPYLVSPGAGAPARRLESWGRLRREGVALGAGVVYMTEDAPDACFYRFVPADAANPFGEGRLDVLCIPGLPTTHRDRQAVLPADFEAEITWRPVPDALAATVACRRQVSEATRFCRCEGIVWDGTSAWFAATQGGRLGKGQLFRLTPAREPGGRDRLRLMLQVEDPRVLSLPDNLARAPWGDLLLCEDNYTSDAVITHQHLRGLTPAGDLYDLARNPRNTPIAPGEAPGDEFTGPCFSPDGSILFVNLQGERDETLAITGPFPGPKRG